MGEIRDKNCQHCDGYGYVYDYLGGCGDPECCGGPFKIRCQYCDNDWEFDDDDKTTPNAELRRYEH